MQNNPYGLICPITKACDILEPRWTIPILSELWAGSSRFNDIRRGVGNISPALLSKRLKEMEANGLVDRVENTASGTVDYFRTGKAIALEPALNAMAMWAQEFIEAEAALADLDVSALMWQMRIYILPQHLPRRRIVMRFHFNDPDLDYDTYWALIHPEGTVEICTDVLDYDIDLYVETTAPSLTAIILKRSTIAREIEAERTFLSGDERLIRSMPDWLKTTGYVCENGVAEFNPLPPAAQTMSTVNTRSS